MSWRAVVMLAVGLAVLCVASPVARRVTWVVARATGRLLVGAVALAVILVRDRRETAAVIADAPVATPDQTPDVTMPGPPPAWRVTLYLSHAGHATVLGRGLLTGPWRRPVEVEGEVLRRYVARYGLPATGRLCCQAEPLPTPRTAAA